MLSVYIRRFRLFLQSNLIITRNWQKLVDCSLNRPSVTSQYLLYHFRILKMIEQERFKGFSNENYNVEIRVLTISGNMTLKSFIADWNSMELDILILISLVHLEIYKNELSIKCLENFLSKQCPLWMTLWSSKDSHFPHRLFFRTVWKWFSVFLSTYDFPI
jgi:hypothetical protein